jgi:phage-related holin
MMDNLRLVAASVLANIVGLMFPIKNDMFVLLLLFTVNFVVGLLADVCNRGEWSFRKAFCFFRDAAIYFVMVASIYLLGHLKGEGETAAHCVSFMIYVAMYFYITNILRNAHMITDEKSTQFRVLDFLYYVFSLRVLEKSQWLSKYFDYGKGGKNMV